MNNGNVMNSITATNRVKANNSINTDNLARYGKQLTWLNMLLNMNMITSKEHYKLKNKLDEDYNIK